MSDVSVTVSPPIIYTVTVQTIPPPNIDILLSPVNVEITTLLPQINDFTVTVNPPIVYSVNVENIPPPNIDVLLSPPVNVEITTPGPQGIPGPQGPQGVQGPQGPSGVSEITLGEITDVEIDNLEDGDFLIYDLATSKWKNKVGLRTEKVILTLSDITNMGVTLPSVPYFSESVMVIPVGGIPQVNGIDFDIIDDFLTWEDLGLEGILEVGEMLVVHY